MFGKDTKIKIIGTTANFRFQSPTTDDWVKDIDHFQRGAKDFGPVFARFGPYMLGDVERNFKAEGRPKWKALAPSTIRERRRQGFGDSPILQRTGKLMRGFRFSYGPRSMRITNTQRQYIYHQEGRGNNPIRLMVQLSSQNKGVFTRFSRPHLLRRGS